MKRLLVAIVAAVPALALADVWNIDTAHTQAGFSVKHNVISTVRGEFGKTTGTANFDDKDITRSSVEATIDVATVNTRVVDRDKDLRSPNFFDVAKYPTITFKSTKVEKTGEGRLRVTGDLTMHGITRAVTLDVEGPTAAIKDPWGNVRRGLSARTRINRKDFGLTWNQMIEAGPVVGDEVAIEIDAELIKAKR